MQVFGPTCLRPKRLTLQAASSIYLKDSTYSILLCHVISTYSSICHVISTYSSVCHVINTYSILFMSCDQYLQYSFMSCDQYRQFFTSCDQYIQFCMSCDQYFISCDCSVHLLNIFTEEAGSRSKETFLGAAYIMSQFSHPNVLSLFGVCITTPPLITVLTFMNVGDLKHFLTR